MFVYFQKPIEMVQVTTEDSGIPLDVRAERALTAIQQIRARIGAWKEIESRPGASSILRAEARERIARAQVEFAGQWMNVESLLYDSIISQRVLDLEAERRQGLDAVA